MYDNFPRIYSLSTIGVKQHYNADYLFHPYRTDFSGDSGSGKSMISDMIQLVLVGSSDFKSSTDANKDRDVKGMLVSEKGKSSTRGYVFLNVEIRPKKYFVIGAYIEGTSNAAEMFIIQNGYDWDNMTPLTKPFFAGDLLFDEKIETLQVSCEKLTLTNMKSFKRKNYHKILHESQILALDLTKDSTLKAYGNILRSFSRGKGFKKESESLKRFLFGDEEQNVILEKYKEEVNNINNDFHEHKRYVEEIDLITEKQKTLKGLLDKNKHYKASYSHYLAKRFAYWNKIKLKQTLSLNQSETEIKNGELEFKCIEQRLLNVYIDNLKDLKKMKAYLNKKSLSHEEKKIIDSQYLAARQIVDDIEIIEEQLKINNGSVEDLGNWHKEQQQLKADKDSLIFFNNFLLSYNIKEDFETSGWFNDFKNERSNYSQKVETWSKEIADLESLTMFSDIENPESLLRWAMENLKFPLTPVEESILIYFQKYGKTKPLEKSYNRYVPFPENLFEDIESKVMDENESGFWLDLDGVYEFIRFERTPVHEVTDPSLIIDKLYKIKENIKNDLNKASSEKAKYENFRENLFMFTGELERHVELYKRKDALEECSIDKRFAELKENSFNTLRQNYFQRDTYIFNYQKARKLYENMIQAEKIAEDFRKNIKELEERYFKDKKLADVEELERIIADNLKDLASINNMVEDAIASDLGSEKLKQGNYFRDINDEIILTKDESRVNAALARLYMVASKCTEDIKRAQEELDDSTLQNLNLNLNFNLEANEAIALSASEPDINALRQKAISAQTSFDEYLKLVTGDLKFDTSVSIGQLAHHFLPTIFPNTIVNEELIDMNISERLHKLTRDIQEIGSRKIEILGSIFNEVYKVYMGYLTKINLIDGYLKKNNKLITGGNRASLSYNKSNYYPESWLASFRKQLNSQVGNSGLFSELKEELDINKMMMQAFQSLGGSSKVTPEDLMNPQSYFDLEFDLKLENDEINSGSTGQTYAANALLCLARLSLIEDKNKRGLRVMPIDEAEGLGSNYDMLHDLAKNEKYQLITMAIETAGEINDGDQYIYIMNDNKSSDKDSYVPPFGVFSDPDTIIENISHYINSLPHDE